MALVKEIFDGIDKVLDNFGPPMIRPNYYDTVRPLFFNREFVIAFCILQQ